MHAWLSSGPLSEPIFSPYLPALPDAQLGGEAAEAAEVDSGTAGHTSVPSELAAAPLPPPPQYSVNTRSLTTPSPVPSTASAPMESLQAPSSLGGGPAEGGDNVARATISDAGGNQALPAAYTAAPTPLLRPSPQSASASSSSEGHAPTAAVQAVRTPTAVPASAVAAAAAAGASSEDDVRRAYSEMKRAYDDMKV